MGFPTSRLVPEVWVAEHITSAKAVTKGRRGVA
jgi:hypothetical protein